MDEISKDFALERRERCVVLHFLSTDQMNRLTLARVETLTCVVARIGEIRSPLVLSGGPRAFSVGADLNEVNALSSTDALAFAEAGQLLMRSVADFPAPVFAAISGYCMGGGLDLALAAHVRICSPVAVIGHRGAALGIMTGWGGTQRLSALLGRACALQMFCAAERLSASKALEIGLVDEIVPDPLVRCIELAESCRPFS